MVTSSHPQSREQNEKLTRDKTPEGEVPKAVAAAFCPRLWDEMELTGSGSLRPCCLFDGAVKNQGAPVTVYNTNPAKYSDASDLWKLRAEVLSGHRVSACRKCYRAEDLGGRSIRQTTIHSRGGIASAVAAATVGSQAPSVRKLMIEFGDKCALRCRMCRPYHSTSIAADKVQAGLLFSTRQTDTDYAALHALPRTLRWYEDERFCTTTLVEACADVDELKVVGGEPFISPNFMRFLKALASSGLAKQLDICVTTSGSIKGNAWLAAIDAFRGKTINLSMDGVGNLNAYIRAGSDWKLIERFIDNAKQASVPVQILTTVQAYNLLRLHEIAAFAREGGHSWWPSWLFDPVFLDPSNFPASRREVFLDGVQRQLMANSSKQLQDYLLEYFSRLALASTEADTHWNGFVRYTQKLDDDRDQSLAGLVPELFARLA